MNRDDILRMALEAGFWGAEETAPPPSTFDEQITIAEYSVGDTVERFAALVAAAEREANLQQIEIIVEAAVAAEREACIKFLKSVDLSGLAVTPGLQMYTAELIEGFIEAIRARGEA